jgi:hypothetical protein
LVEAITTFDLVSIVKGIRNYFSIPDVLLWSYFLLAVSNTMLPSKSDRRAWFPALIAFLFIYLSSVLVVVGSPASTWLVEQAKVFTKVLIKAFGVAATFNLFLLLPLWLFYYGLKKIRR